jgi:hypothetical protein
MMRAYDHKIIASNIPDTSTSDLSPAYYNQKNSEEYARIKQFLVQLLKKKTLLRIQSLQEKCQPALFID